MEINLKIIIATAYYNGILWVHNERKLNVSCEHNVQKRTKQTSK